MLTTLKKQSLILEFVMFSFENVEVFPCFFGGYCNFLCLNLVGFVGFALILSPVYKILHNAEIFAKNDNFSPVTFSFFYIIIPSSKILNKGEKIMKNEENDILKMLALQAKMRMKNGAYNKKSQTGSNLVSRGMRMYVSNFSADYRLLALSTKEDDEILEKVKDMMKDDKDIINPIKQLVDQVKFDKMSDVEKMRYTLSVSEKYRNFVNQCNKEIV